jgi:spore coat polysaccharide biosynthesis protein SpsF
MKIVAIIQARTRSTRLPGKVLMDLAGHTVLARVVRRLTRAKLVEQIVVATTDHSGDNAIIRECQHLGVSWFRGSGCDVLDRYYCAARAYAAGAVVRVTSDCPLIDPELLDETVQTFLAQEADYASNVFPRTYPRGLDVEVFTMPALERAWREARELHQREHVTPYLYEHPELFCLIASVGRSDFSHHRWTLDTVEDLQFLRAIYSGFDNRDTFGWREVIALLEREPELADLNSHVLQKSLHGD